MRGCLLEDNACEPEAIVHDVVAKLDKAAMKDRNRQKTKGENYFTLYRSQDRQALRLVMREKIRY
jgi:hypothetical protein